MKNFFKKYEIVIAHSLTILGLAFVFYQLYQSNEHKRWENYNAMNLRYYEWYANMPQNMDVDTCVPFSEQKQEVKRWARTYFNLYSEEYWLYLEKLIPEEMWTKRIDNGVDVNLKTYPLLVRGYKYWREKDSFVHPDGFRDLVDKKLMSLKSELKLLSCKGTEAPKESVQPSSKSNTPLKKVAQKAGAS